MSLDGNHIYNIKGSQWTKQGPEYAEGGRENWGRGGGAYSSSSRAGGEGTGSLVGAGEGSEVGLGFVGHCESGFYTGDFPGS